MSPKVSFVMPVFNAIAWIGEAIQSVLMQTVKEIELIIVDDCSTDGTKEFLDEWASQFPNVKIIHNETNLGAGMSRNIGTQAASAPIIAITDGDDINADQRAELILKHFELNPESELVNFPYVSIGYYNEDLEHFDGAFFDHELFLEKGISTYYSNPTAAVKKESLLAVGGFGKEEFSDTTKKTDDQLFLEKWVRAGKKVDFQQGAYTVFHRNLPNSMMSKIRGWRPEWAEKQA
jgi:glycosyltransferase involved in cell wall biosynthesis